MAKTYEEVWSNEKKLARKKYTEMLETYINTAKREGKGNIELMCKVKTFLENNIPATDDFWRMDVKTQAGTYTQADFLRTSKAIVELIK